MMNNFPLQYSAKQTFFFFSTTVKGSVRVGENATFEFLRAILKRANSQNEVQARARVVKIEIESLKWI